MNDEVKEYPEIAAQVELTDLLFYVVGLKRRALNNNDKDLYDAADRIEHELKLLRDPHTSFVRWG